MCEFCCEPSCCDEGLGGIGLAPEIEAGVFDLEPTDPGDGSGLDELFIRVASPFTSSVEESFGLER